MIKNYIKLIVALVFATNVMAQNFNTYWKTFKTSNSLLLSDSITDIQIDSYGTKYIGTKKGYTIINGKNWKSTSSFPINQIGIDSKNTVWLVGKGGVIFGNSNNWTPLNLVSSGLTDKNINSIAFDQNGSVWLTTYNNIAVYNGSNWINYNNTNTSYLNDSINSILIDKNNQKWIGTTNGVVKYDGTNWSKINISITDVSLENGKTSLNVDKIYQDNNNQIYFITKDGIVKYDSFNTLLFKGKTKTIYSEPDNIILGLNENSDCGVNNIVFSINNFTQNFGCQDGTPGAFERSLSNGSNKIIKDELGNLWIATDAGLIKNYNNPNQNLNSEINISINKCTYLFSVCSNSNVLHPTFIFPGHNSAELLIKNLGTNICFNIGNNEISAFNDYYVFEGDVVQNGFNGSGIGVLKKTIWPTSPPSYSPNICMVTNINGKNTILWENTAETFISKYRIYKQNKKTSTYDLVNEQDKSKLSQWDDTTSNNQVERYLLAYVDSCGKEHQGSNHTTLMLSSNVGLNGTVNLAWNAYEGFDYPNFEIWRSTDGVNFSLLSSVANNTFAYIDNNPPATAWYQIRITKQDACIATKRGENYVGSNIISKEGKSLYINEQKKESFTVYPNPTKDLITINNAHGNTIRITDLQGKEVYNALATSAKTEISLKYIGAKGMYILHIVDEKGVSIENKKIVLE
ncbi:MAG: hypothetical protein KA264_05995 [Crocinitomicaceae bacterium]|nr:hypothetical protein [Crocinitomicaceae bacterium]